MDLDPYLLCKWVYKKINSIVNDFSLDLDNTFNFKRRFTLQLHWNILQIIM